MNFTTNATKNANKAFWPGFYTYIANIRYVFAVMEILLTPIIVSANILLIVSILSNKTLRREFRYLVMISIALADLLIGLISCPFRADMVLKSTYQHGCLFYLFMTVTESYVQIFVGMWGIVTINLDYLLTLFHVKRPQLKTFPRNFVIAVILGLPWLAMFFVVLPIAYLHAKEYFAPFRYCRLIIPYDARQIVMSLTFIAPAIITVVQVTIMTSVHLYRQRTGSGMPSLMTSPEAVPLPWTYVAGSLVTVIMVGFEQCINMAQRAFIQALMPQYKIIFFMKHSSHFLSDSKSGVTPIVWFTIPELRAAFIELVNKLPWRRRLRRSDDAKEQTVRYRNLCEDTSMP
ncbi:uncharacterized protein LOC124131442 [Haliotis rufescens]|uniref:uncharacterized protein LOC124131442 n=1 Tax=Haliotis rufescens TaxID=6454 RepID=UPI00201E7DFB|nr:uncharacterized protein LOC124131442 [Haliotis rufescens]